MTPARGRAFAGALALTAASAVWTLAGASPASAYVCAFGIDSPVAGSISGAATLHVTGPFVARQGIADRSVDVSVIQSPGVAPAGVTVTGAAVGPADRFDVPVGPLTRNGRYTVRVRARHAGMAALLNCANGLGADQRDTERTAEVSFGVSVQALPPANVAARFDAAARRAVVSWDTSTDPDVAGYTVSRAVGGSAPTEVRVAPDTHSWTDSSLPGDAATLTYSVQASRNGPDAGTTSLPSSPVSVRLDVPAASAAPAPAPTAAAGRSPGTRSPTTAPFVLGLPVGGSSPETSVPAGPPDSTPAAPDDGSSQNPPSQPADLGGGGSSNGDPAVVGGASDGGGGGVPQLAFVAAGVLSTVVAAQVLWLRRQSLRPARAGAQGASDPLEPVEPSGPRPGGDPVPPDPDAEVFAAPASAAPAGAATPERAAAGLAAGAAGARPTRGVSDLEGRAAGAPPGTDGATSAPPASDGRDAGAGPRVAVGRGPVDDDATPEAKTAHVGATPEGLVAGGAGEVDAGRLRQGTPTGLVNGAEHDPAGLRPSSGRGAGAAPGSAGGSEEETAPSLRAMGAPMAGVILRPSRDGSGRLEPVGATDAAPPRREAVAASGAARRRRPLRSPTRSAELTNLEREQMPEAARRRRPLRSPTRAPAEPVEAAPDQPAAAIDPAAASSSPEPSALDAPILRARRPLRSPTRLPPEAAATPSLAAEPVTSPLPEAEPAASPWPEPAPIAADAPTLRPRRPLRSPTRVPPEPVAGSSLGDGTEAPSSGVFDAPFSRRRRPLRSPTRVPPEPVASSSLAAEPERLPSGAVAAPISPRQPRRRQPLRSADRPPAEAPDADPASAEAADAAIAATVNPGAAEASGVRMAASVNPGVAEASGAQIAASVNPGTAKGSDASAAAAVVPGTAEASGALIAASVDPGTAEASGASVAATVAPGAAEPSDGSAAGSVVPGTGGASDGLFGASVVPGTADAKPPRRSLGRRRPLRSPTRSAVAPAALPVDDLEAVNPARPVPAAPTVASAPLGQAVLAPAAADTAAGPRMAAETEDVRREPAEPMAASPKRPVVGGSVEASPGSTRQPEPTGTRTEAPLPVQPGIVAPVEAGEAPVEPPRHGWVEAVPLPGRELELAASRPIWEPSADPVPVRLPPAAEAWLWEPPAPLDLEEGATAAPAGASLVERQTWQAMAGPRRRASVSPSRSGAAPPWPGAGAGADDQPVEAASNGAGDEAAGRHRAGEGDPPPDKLLLILKPEGRGPG